ncbi:unnamed protein product [Mucor fragilis]
MANKQLPADLESFVSNEVASLCDADPVVLAQYIIALIGTGECNDALKTNLESKLNEFFDDQTIPFIDRLFAKINQDNAAGSSDAAPAAAAASSSSTSNTNKERFTDFSDDEDDGDRNFKHRRQRSHSPEEQSRSYNKRRYDDDSGSSSNPKYQRYDDRRSNNSSGGYSSSSYEQRGGSRGGRGAMRGRGGSGMNRGQNKPQCRDYNEKGFCMRGDMCPFDHGMDRIIVDEGANGPFPAGPFPNNGMPPMGRGGPGQPPFFGMPGVPDAYDPERSGMMGGADMGAAFGGMMPPNGPDMMNMMRGGMRGGRGRGGRGRGGNHGGYQRHQHQNMNPLNTTLNVEKIPVEFCQISTVNDFFAKFGTITNISVQPHVQKAIIQYSTRAEAEAAYNSPDAIFDNRFVKVYWSKEDPTAPFNADKTSAAGTATGAPAAPKANEPDPELVAARAAEIAKAREEKQKKHQEQMKHILEIQKKRETQLQQQIDEQKRLLAKLTNSANMTQTEKAELLKALKNIQSDIDTSKNAAANEAAQARAATSASAATEQQGAAAADVKEGEETTEDLKKKLARLEAEAANLGIHGSGFRGGRGGYYGGRGRGGSSWARGGGRGGAVAPRTMSLDNRPTKIAVKDIPESTDDAELRQHFQQFGNVTLFEQKDREALVQYAQRFEAEKAMAAGPHFPKGTLQLDWFNQQTTTEE